MKSVTKSGQPGKNLSLDTIRRLSRYMRALKRVSDDGRKTISSGELANMLGITSAQLRKDLSFFGRFGKNGVGYHVDDLFATLQKIIGTDTIWNVAIVGVGELGTALARYQGFEEFHFRVCAAFDTDPLKIGKKINGVTIRHISEFGEAAKTENIHIAMLSVSRDSAQQAADAIISAGIKAILNFVHVNLSLPENVYLTNMDVSCELETLICRMRNGI